MFFQTHRGKLPLGSPKGERSESTGWNEGVNRDAMGERQHALAKPLKRTGML
jgi:hypothetical protein